MDTDVWRLKFNEGTTAQKRAKVRRFYHSTSAFAAGPANLRLANDGTYDFAEVCLSGPQTNIVNFREAGDMLGATPTAGPGANCFSENPLYHGYFEPDGTSWGDRLGDVRIDAWPDPNHRGDLTDPINAGNAWLTLPFQGFGTNEDGTHTLDDIVDQTRDGFPYMTDLRGLELEYIMRAREWRQRRIDKLLQHFQVRVPYHGPFSSYLNDDDEVTPRYAYVNAVQIADPISDQLMLGQGGFGEPNAVDGVHDSGWRKVRVRLSPLASHWKMLGGMTGRSGLDGETLAALNYVVEKPDNFLQNPAGLPYCMFMVGYHPVLDEATRDTLHVNRLPTGKLQIREVALVRPG